MTPDRNSYADIWEMLDGKYAERVRVTDAALVGDEEIVRRWPEIGQGYLSRCMTALKLFTDAKNSTAKSWVENPVCGRETFPGIYRVVTVDVDVQKPGLKGIIQTLRKGWAQTPVWSEARLLEEESGPSNNVSDSGAVPASDNPTRFLKIKFPNCDPGKVEAIASSLGGVSTYSNVVIRGESYSGTWNTVFVATKLEDDGSGTVVLNLALGQYNIKSYDNWGTEREADIFYVYDCPKNEAQTIIDAWKAKYPVGSSATTNYSRSNGLVDLVLRRKTETYFEVDFGTTGLDCRYTETQTAIFGTQDDKAYPIPTVTFNAGVSYTRTARSNGDGTFDIILTKREVRYRDITGLVVEQTGESETVQRQQLGLTDETPEPMTEEPGAIKTQRVEVRDDCSRDVTTNTETGKEQTSTAKVEAAGYSETTTEKTVQTSPASAPVQSDGHIRTTRTQPSKYPGRYDTVETDREVKPLDATAAGGGPLWDEVSEVNDNATTDLSGQAAGGAGVIIDTASKKNDAGRFDNRKTTRTAKPFGPVTSVHGSPLVEETVERSRNQDSMPSPGTPADGTTVDVSGSINDAAKIDVTKTTRRAIAKEKIGIKTGENEFESETTDLHVNKESVVIVRASGEVVDANLSINEFGRLSGSVRKREGKPVVSGPFTEHDDGYKKVTKTIHRNIDNPPVISHDDNGHDIAVSIAENGKKDVIETQVTAQKFYFDVDEPASGNQAPRYQRFVYGLKGNGELQPEVQNFFAKVRAQTGHQYRVSAAVNRDENGFYILTLTANPKDSGGGGGSAQQWETGLDIDWPEAVKYQNVTTTKAYTKLTSSRANAQAFVNFNHGVLVDSGVGGQTGAHYIGRGRFLVVKNIKVT